MATVDVLVDGYTSDDDIDGLVPLELMSGDGVILRESRVEREARTGNHTGAIMIGYVIGAYAAVVGGAVVASGLGLSELANCF